VSASDACEESGLVLAELSDRTRAALAERVVSVGTSFRNPIDVGMVLFGATDLYGGCLRVALADPGVDAAVVIGGDHGNPQGFAEMLVEASSQSGKPVLYALTGDFPTGETQELLNASGVVTAPSAERALRAYARLARLRPIDAGR
jgi:acyl-CoA synthetase (NDP forming)